MAWFEASHLSLAIVHIFFITCLHNVHMALSLSLFFMVFISWMLACSACSSSHHLSHLQFHLLVDFYYFSGLCSMFLDLAVIIKPHFLIVLFLWFDVIFLRSYFQDSFKNVFSVLISSTSLASSKLVFWSQSFALPFSFLLFSSSENDFCLILSKKAWRHEHIFLLCCVNRTIFLQSLSSWHG